MSKTLSSPDIVNRLSVEEWLAFVTQAVAGRATCTRASVGAVAVTPTNRIFATGYNGAPKGHKHCIDEGVGCLMVDNHCIRCNHAEYNLIDTCVDLGIAFLLEGSTLWVTHKPCKKCAAWIADHKILRVYYLNDYGDDAGVQYLITRGVLAEQYKGKQGAEANTGL